MAASSAVVPLFKVRTITTGVHLDADPASWEDTIRRTAEFNVAAARAVAALGVEVQTIRIATNSFQEYAGAAVAPAIAEGKTASAESELQPDQMVAALAPLKAAVEKHAAGQLVSIGPATTPAGVACVPAIVSKYGFLVSAAVGVTGPGVPDLDMLKAAAAAMQGLATGTEGGEGCFNFAATFNCGPGTPFFPVGYHRGNASIFSIGFEDPEMLVQAFQSAAGDIAEAVRNLQRLMQDAVDLILPACTKLEAEYGIKFGGFDTSIAPSVVAADGHTIVDAFESVGLGKFGGSGTLCLASLVTKAVKAVHAPLVGYCGLMLPPLEDPGLARAAAAGQYNIRDLLTLSAVCGIGLDTVPIPGDTPPSRIVALMADICGLAFRLNKPLSCRLFLVAGAKPGEIASYTNPNLCKSAVFAVE